MFYSTTVFKQQMIFGMKSMAFPFRRIAFFVCDRQPNPAIEIDVRKLALAVPSAFGSGRP
jgi:hypothetical protein